MLGTRENMNHTGQGWDLMDQFFQQDEIQVIVDRLTRLRPETVICCSMENRFARSGGLAAVIGNSPAFLNDAAGTDALLITPFHSNIIGDGRLTPLGKSVYVEWREEQVQVDLFSYDTKVKSDQRTLNVTEYYVRAAGFWEADNRLGDPYVYTQDTQKNNELLKRDALFFCKVVPHVARELGRTSHLILHLHEWQTALLALVAKDAMLDHVLESCGTVQTIHNPFDAQISMGDLEMLVGNETVRNRVSARADQGRDYGEMTAYAIGLGLVDAPIAVVSEHFAEQLVSDILHTQYYAPHLQDRFAGRLIGINNGPFVARAKEFPRGESHSMREVRDIKLEQRAALLDILASYHPPERFGNLTYRGGSIRELPVDIPVFVMTGRLDPSQRGYDVLFRALEGFGTDEIKTILAPMPTKESDLDYFRDVASKCDGDLTVFPIRMKAGYHELQTGSTFSVWPSIYEPFGGAIEYMANGTPVIARASGGLVNQVVHLWNGILYLEPDKNYSMSNLTEFFMCRDSVHTRESNPWVNDMVDALRGALQVAIRIYQERSQDYYQMVLNGFRKTGDFSWQKNTAEYLTVYSSIAARAKRL